MQTLIFLNGKFPRIKVINFYRKKNTRIIAADGGANKLATIEIIPDTIIGDFDSVRKKNLKYLRGKKVKVLKIVDDETTDLEKCLKFCIENKLEDVILFGATSMRPDHTLNNFSVLKRYYKKMNITIVTNKFEAFFIEKSFSLNYKSGEIISMFAMPLATNIKTTGLMYPLNNENLEFGVREGALNKSSSDKISITFNSGDLLLFKKHFI